MANLRTGSWQQSAVLEPTSAAGLGRRSGRENIYIKREERRRVNKKLDRSWEKRKVRGGAVLLGCEPRAK